MPEYIEKDVALSFPFANGEYDHANANERFIFGCETYKEWLEQIPAADVVEVVRCGACLNCEKVDDYEWWCSGRGWPKVMVTKDDYCSWGRCE